MDKYISYKGAPASNTKRIIEFITKQVEGEDPNDVLNIWNVSLASLQRNKPEELFNFAGIQVKPLTRSLKEEFLNNRLFVKRIVSNIDEKIDFEQDSTATGEELRRLSPRNRRPLLTIYPLIIERFGSEKFPESEKFLELPKMPFGFGISWPNNDMLKQTTYDINRVYKELELANYD